MLLGSILLAISAVGNGLLGWYLIRLGKKTDSLTLIADGKHVSTDMVTTFAILVGLGLIYLTGIVKLDGVIACIAGLSIFYSGFHIVRSAFDGLMDRTEEDTIQELCQVLNESRIDGWVGVHRLRCWSSGSQKHIDMHLILPRHLQLEEAHRITEELRELLNANVQGADDVMIYIDSCKEEECKRCSTSGCGNRHVQAIDVTGSWDCASIILDRKHS